MYKYNTGLLLPRFLLVVLCSASTLGLAGQNLVENGSFESAFTPIRNAGQAKLSGEIPEGWRDNSGWNDVIGHYEKIGDAATGDLVVSGQQALRMRHMGAQAERRTVQQLAQIVELEESKVYRLAGAMRSPFSPLAGGHRQGFALIVRDQGSPYATYASISEDLDVDWSEYETSFTVPASGTYVVLAQMYDEGVADLDAVVLEQAEFQEYTGPFAEENLLPNGRFPVGAGGPFTWSFDWQVSESKRVDSPLGQSGIYLPKHFNFKTPPIGIIPGRPYTFSVYLKSDTPNLPVEVYVSSTSRTANVPLLSQNWNVTTEWDRYEFSMVVPPVPHDTIYVTMRNSRAKGIALDGLRFEEGREMREYNFEERTEVSIGLPPAAMMQGIYLEGETALLPVGVTGVWEEGASVQLQLTDVFGEKAFLPAINLPTPSGFFETVVSIAPDTISAERTLGSFRLEARVIDDRGDPLSPISEMTFMRVPAPVNPDELAHDSPAGIHTRFNSHGFLMAQKMGFKWIRNHDSTPGGNITKWREVETRRGEFEWQDELLEKITNHGLLLLGLIDTTPDWASRRPEGYWPEEPDYQRRGYIPENLDDYKRYLKTLATHYKGRIHAYEVWNEPYSSTYFRDYRNGETVHGSPADLVALHKVASETLKEVDKDILVVGVCSGSGLTSYIERAFEHGIYPHYDILAFHQYSNFRHPFNEVGNPSRLVETEAKHGGGDSILWNTEGSPMPRISFFQEVNPIPEATKSEWSIEGGPLELAAMYPRFMLSNLAHGAEKVFFYSFAIRPAMVEERGFKLLEPTGVPIPGMGAVAALNRLLNTGAKVTEVTNPADNVVALLFEGPDSSFIALQSIDGNAVEWTPRNKPENIILLDLFGNKLNEFPGVTAAPLYLVSEGANVEELKRWLR